MPALPRNSCRPWKNSTPSVTVTRGSETVGGTSIMGLMMLSAATGTEITVEASGKQADEAMAAIDELGDQPVSARKIEVSVPAMQAVRDDSRDHIKKSLYPYCRPAPGLL